MGIWNKELSADATLADAELSQFAMEGWVGSFPLLNGQGVKHASEIASRVKDKFVMASQMSPKRPWFKSMHAYIPEFCDITCHPAIVNRVKAILGRDVLAWGLCITTRKPGQVHRWHVDVEHRRWQGVSVFLGLKGMSRESTLKVISHTHKIDATPQALSVNKDESVLKKAQECQPDSRLVAVDLKEGEFFIFDGPLWHGSANAAGQTRMAMVIQYCRPSARVEMPLNWNEPIKWGSVSPPCVLVCGEDHYGINRLVERPSRAFE